MIKQALCVILTGFSVVYSFSQVTVFEPMSPGIDFINARTYSLDAGRKYNPESSYSHPDFGKLTFDAPFGKNVVEDISKRTYDSRYYIDLNDPTFFYIQKSSTAINMLQNGIWRAIDPTLHAVSANLYRSGVQPCPTKLDLGNKQTGIQLGETEFKFNHYLLRVVHNDHSVTLYQANWSQIVVGNEGAYITDLFPGIDFKLVFAQGSVKSDFIIRENLHVKKLVFIDQLEVPAHLNGFIYTNGAAVQNGPVIFENIHTGEAEIKFNRARCHDASENKRSWINPYTLNGNNLEILCDSAQLNDPAMIYPITIDPLVTVVGPIASPNSLMGSLPSPASCSHTINVTYPGGTTPWDVSAFWRIDTDFCSDDLIDYGFYFDCYRSEAQVWITSSCGGISPTAAPGTIWTCVGCNNYGTWNPTLPFASSGTQSLAQCYTPSCSNQNLAFIIHSNRSYCTNFYGYDNCNYASNSCNFMNNWSVTLQGRNAETLTNTATGNGSATYAAPTCASGTTLLNPGALYGVPGYTYSWNTGATSSTLTVPNGPVTYTCQVTDACGTVRTATFTITCPLAVNLNSFEATNSGNEVALNWSTGFEKENHHFVILRAGSDLQFEEIGQVMSHGDSENAQFYSFMDRNPLDGINYYQLATVDITNQLKLSDIRSIERTASSEVISVSPNPSNGSFTLRMNAPETGEYALSIVSAEGKLVSKQVVSLEKGSRSIPFNKLNLEKGTYIVRVQKGKFDVEEKMVVE